MWGGGWQHPEEGKVPLMYHIYQLLSEKIAVLDDLETAQTAVTMNLSSTILSNYFFTESGGGTFIAGTL